MSAKIKVPYGQSVHGEEEIKAVIRVLETSTQMGQCVFEMERQCAALFAKRYGIMVNSGSSANYLAMEALELAPGSEIITPALTFATTVGPILKNQCTPIFIDVCQDSYNINVQQIDAHINSKTKAMLIPNLLGNLPDWDALRAIADAHQLILIEDSADTIGAKLRQQSTGTRSDISTTSFYGNHLINCAGNGGMLCVNDERIALKTKLLRSWGRDSSLYQDSESIENRFDSINVDDFSYDKKFLFSMVGYNLEPSEIGAAFGLEQLKKLERFVAIRKQNFTLHQDFFRHYQDIFFLPRSLEQADHAWMNFPLTIKPNVSICRNRLQIHLEQQGIQTRPIFTGNILRQPAFRHLQARQKAEDFAIADHIMRNGLLIGCHQGLNAEKINYMHQQFKRFLTQHKK